jgi:hypothetical protein
MDKTTMTNTHDAPWLWHLGPRAVRRVSASRRARWLAVEQGRVWITRSQGDQPAEDLWLQAGERLPLPPGSEWVAEGWPDARVALLEAPQDA